MYTQLPTLSQWPLGALLALAASWVPLWSLLGAFWEPPGSPWCLLGAPWEPSGSILGVLQGVPLESLLGAFWDSPGSLWWLLGASWEPLGLLGASWVPHREIER